MVMMNLPMTMIISVLSRPGYAGTGDYLHGFSKAGDDWLRNASYQAPGIDGSDDEDSSIYDVMCADLNARRD